MGVGVKLWICFPASKSDFLIHNLPPACEELIQNVCGQPAPAWIVVWNQTKTGFRKSREFFEICWAETLGLLQISKNLRHRGRGQTRMARHHVSQGQCSKLVD